MIRLLYIEETELSKFAHRVRSVAVLLALGTCLTTGHAATFKDPLDQPAMMSSLAPTFRLTAVTKAGNRLVAVGPFGHIVVSDDNGGKWQQVPCPVNSDLLAVKFINADKGWAVGHDSVVLYTSDGGRTWVKQFDGNAAAKAIKTYYAKLEAAGQADAKLIADAQRFVDEGADKPFLDVLFISETEGWVVGAFNLAFRTKDGGATWEPIIERTDNPLSMHMYALAASGREVYMAGEQGLLWRWNYDKDRFEQMSSPYKGTFFGVQASDSQLLIFGMQGHAYVSPDRGASWQKLTNNSTAGVAAAILLADGRVVLTTQRGGLLVCPKGSAACAAVKADKPMSYMGVAEAGGNALVLVGSGGARMQSIK